MNGTSAPKPAEWLSLAAAPTFAAMALATAAVSGPADALCASGSGWPLDGMVLMYLLMGVFHVAPLLNWLGYRRANDARSIEEESECSPRQIL